MDRTPARTGGAPGRRRWSRGAMEWHLTGPHAMEPGVRPSRECRRPCGLAHSVSQAHLGMHLLLESSAATPGDLFHRDHAGLPARACGRHAGRDPHGAADRQLGIDAHRDHVLSSSNLPQSSRPRTGPSHSAAHIPARTRRVIAHGSSGACHGCAVWDPARSPRGTPRRTPAGQWQPAAPAQRRAMCSRRPPLPHARARSADRPE